MLSRVLARLVALFAICSLLVVAGCSDDSTTDPGGGGSGSGDVTAPLVIRLTPDNQDINVALDQTVIVSFSEPVDQATVAAALTLSAGTVTNLDWNSDGTGVEVSHSDWPEGVTVTVTVGTGVTDLAGNALAQDFSTVFYTYASAPVMVGYDFYAPLDDVPLNGFFDLSFSRAMDRNSILANYSLTVGATKDLPGIIVGSVDGDSRRVRVSWDGTLAPQQTYRFSISTGATTVEGDPLSEPVVIDFTTGLELDETPPYILSTSPAVDAVADASLSTVTVTFSEPVDQNTTSPESAAGVLVMFMAREPVWNAAGDQLTLYLTGPLPAGVRLYAIWGAESFKDMAGNANTAADSLSFTVSGTPELFPVRDDLRTYYDADGGPFGSRHYRQTIENISGDNFDRVVMELTDTGFDEPQEHWYMARSGLSILFRGFQEGQQANMFDQPLSYLPSPLPANWSGSTTVSDSAGTIDLTFTGTRVETYRDHWSSDKVVGTRMYLDNCVVVDIYHAMSPAGSSEVFEDGTDTVYLCPGLGIIGMDSVGHEYDGGVVVDSWDDSYYLYGAAVDDRFEDR